MNVKTNNFELCARLVARNGALLTFSPNFCVLLSGIFNRRLSLALHKSNIPLFMGGLPINNTSDNLLYRTINARLNSKEQVHYSSINSLSIQHICATCLKFMPDIRQGISLPAYVYTPPVLGVIF